LRQRTAGDPASPVKNADDGNKIVVGHVAVNHNIRGNEANSNESAKLGAGRAAFGERRQAQIERVKVRLIAVGDKLACLRGKIADNRGGIGVRRFGDDAPLFPGGKTRGVARPVFLKGDEIAAFQRRQALVNQRLRPCHIIVLVARVAREFGNAVVDQLARRFLDRRKIAGRDVRFDPRFLFGCEGYRHAFLYHENCPVSTVKSGRQYGTEFRNKKAQFCQWPALVPNILQTVRKLG